MDQTINKRAHGYGAVEGDSFYPPEATACSLGSKRRRVIFAFIGILCLIAAHCIVGFIVYDRWNGVDFSLVSSSNMMRKLNHGLVASLEASIVRKSLTIGTNTPKAQKGRVKVLPRTIKKDVLNAWWKSIEPPKQSLQDYGEKYLRAYSDVVRDKRELSRVEAAVVAARRFHGARNAPSAAASSQRTTKLLAVDAGDGVNGLGLDVPSLRHFERAADQADYYVAKYKYGRRPTAARRRHLTHRAAAATRRSRTQSLLDPASYPAVDFPWVQRSLDSGVSGGPVRTLDTPKAQTCPFWIPNCRPQHNTLTSCHFSCGAYCQALRGNGPCFTGGADGEGKECKFGYRGSKYTPDPSTRDESGWLEGRDHWKEGGPDDCMTCPVGFKVRPEYGDGTGRCEPCGDGWLDPATGAIVEPGCAGGQFVALGPGGGEPGQMAATEEYENVAGCEPTAEMPQVGAKVLARVPDELKETSPFFQGFEEDWYPGVIFGWDQEGDVLSVQYDDNGPLVEYDPGIPASLGTDVIPLPDVGDKVTLSQAYWDACCNETYNPQTAGPLVMGEVGEVLRSDPPGSGPEGAAAGYTVLAPDGRQWVYSAGEVLRLVGEVKCPLPGEVTLNTVGQVPNNLLELEDLPKGGSEAASPGWWKKAAEDPDCCCCARDLWVGCWGWCGDGTAPKSLHQLGPQRFRAGFGAAAAPRDWSAAADDAQEEEEEAEERAEEAEGGKA